MLSPMEFPLGLSLSSARELTALHVLYYDAAHRSTQRLLREP
jgi:hypothetical protein